MKHEGFRYFMLVVCSKFWILSSLIMSHDCFELFNKEMLNLMNELKNSYQRVCLPLTHSPPFK